MTLSFPTRRSSDLPLPRVAVLPGGLDDQPHRILIAIDTDVVDGKDVAGGLALLPQRLAAARPEMRFPRRDRRRERLGIHMRDHQHLEIGRASCRERVCQYV